MINIASAYISLNGAQHLQTLSNHLELKKEDIQIYCSSKFNEQQPAEILEFLLTFATVHIVHGPFLHSKAYEVHAKDTIITYTGSANLTEAGMSNNNELMTKSVSTKTPLEAFWEYLWQNCVSVNDEIINFYRELPIVSYYPNLSEFYFNVDDYRIFNEEYWHSGTAEVKERRKATQ